MADAAFETLWKHVLDHWDEDKAHGAFLEHCRSAGQLAEAAARYRGMTGDRERGSVAQKRLQGVLVLAMAALESTRTPRPEAKTSPTSLLLIAFFVAATLGLLVLLYTDR
jgi:hypothetical protein